MITSEEPKASPAGRYSVAETCRLLGIHRNTLHRYTIEGKIRCGFRRSTNRKFYSGSEIIRFWKASL